MNISISGHPFKDGAEQMAMLFFPKHDRASVTSVLEERGDSLFSGAVVSDGERSARHEATMPFTDSMIRRANFIKRTIFHAATEISDQKAPWGVMTGIRPAKLIRVMLEQGKTPEQAGEWMRNEYYLTPQKLKLAAGIAARELELIKNARPNAVSLYVGIPFCPSRCLYCSFVSHSIERMGSFMEPYVEALGAELRHTANIAARMGWDIECVYVGGGTPTSLPPGLLRKTLDQIVENFDLAHCREFTVEAGRPDTLDAEKLGILREYPVTRISINPQTMWDETLALIGRRHTGDQVIRAFERAKRAGLDNINADLIAGLPSETAPMFRRTLDEVMALQPRGITVHSLCVKRASRLKEELAAHDFEAQAASEMVDYAQSVLTAKGYNPYYIYRQKYTVGNLENTGFALEGYECIYNVHIMEEIQTILAAGAGTVTKLVRGGGIERIFNVKDIRQYLERHNEMLMRKDKIICML